MCAVGRRGAFLAEMCLVPTSLCHVFFFFFFFCFLLCAVCPLHRGTDTPNLNECRFSDKARFEAGTKSGGLAWAMKGPSEKMDFFGMFQGATVFDQASLYI